MWLAASVTDLRKSFDGLCALVQLQLAEDPFSVQLFVFRGRRSDRIKVLWWVTTCASSPSAWRADTWCGRRRPGQGSARSSAAPRRPSTPPSRSWSCALRSWRRPRPQYPPRLLPLRHRYRPSRPCGAPCPSICRARLTFTPHYPPISRVPARSAAGRCAPSGRMSSRCSRVHSGALQGDTPCAAQALLHLLPENRGGPGRLATHRPRPGGPGMLAHVLVSKYADHLPLYRQSQIYARAGA